VQPPQASAQRLTATTHLVTVAASTTAGYAAGIYDIITIYPVFTQVFAKS
jgi:hypothetical protein